MLTKAVAGLTVMFATGVVFADTELPSKMQGKWRSTVNNYGGDAVIELQKRDGYDRAEVKVMMDSVPNGHGGTCYFGKVATVAERKEGVWSISAKHPRCFSFEILVKPVEGKRRFEGNFSSDYGLVGTVFYEWAQ